MDSSSTFSESVRIPSASREIDPEVQRAISEAAQTIRQDLASANGDVERGLRDAFNEIDEARKQVRSALRDATGTVPTVNLSTGTGPSSGSRTDDFVVMKISPAALAELIGERRSEVLKALRHVFPISKSIRLL